MIDLTLLTINQCWLDNKLDIFKVRGAQAALTDYAIATGAYVSDTEHVNNDTSLKGRAGKFYTNSRSGFPDCILALDEYGFVASVSPMGRYIGGRPVLPFQSLDLIPSNGEGVKRAEDGILEVEYGYYPQEVASRKIQSELFYNSKINYTLLRTGNIYTTYDYYTDKKFNPEQNIEYEYNGKRYVRIKLNGFYLFETLSNGINYSKYDNVWFEVQPVKWLIDEKAGVMVTEKIIFAGIPFNDIDIYHEIYFPMTNIKTYMDKYLSKELTQTREPPTLVDQIFLFADFISVFSYNEIGEIYSEYLKNREMNINIKKSYSEAATEVLDILKHTNNSKLKKIPQSFMSFLNEISSKDFIVNLNYDNLHLLESSTKIRYDSISLLKFIYITWWAENEEFLKFKERFNAFPRRTFEIKTQDER